MKHSYPMQKKEPFFFLPPLFNHHSLVFCSWSSCVWVYGHGYMYVNNKIGKWGSPPLPNWVNLKGHNCPWVWIGINAIQPGCICTSCHNKWRVLKAWGRRVRWCDLCGEVGFHLVFFGGTKEQIGGGEKFSGVQQQTQLCMIKAFCADWRSCSLFLFLLVC